MIKTITVLGAGTMGHGIAHAAMKGGFDTRLYDVSAPALDKARAAIEAIVAKGVELGEVPASDARAIAGRLATTSSLQDALADTELVIEAAPERIDLKIDLLARIEALAPKAAVIATNTSALSITEMAGSAKNPRRVAGMHFFNPVHKMKLVEIVYEY